MRLTTLCLLLKDDKVLLAMKKRGFGAGKWNGVGGKVGGRETIKQAAIRETREEIGIKLDCKQLKNVGSLKFYFKNRPELDQHMHVFIITDFLGEPIESEEMKPVWFRYLEVPFSNMWPDDKYWLPAVLSGKKIKGECHFSEDGSSMDSFNIKEV